ncbi:MAG: SCO family protein [Gammaproteobacteria bacterium]|jgi:cytochrome oxidase Cu insertion factor (SCO1/SenC/PrrC family)
MMIEQQAVRRSRIKLVILFAIFLIPVIAAYIIHKHPEWQPKGTINHGVLYKPSVRIKPFSLLTEAGKPYKLSDMTGKWSLIYIGGANCDKDCRVTLIKARDARWAQGTEATRIKYYYLLTADRYNGDKAKLHKAFPEMVMLHGDPGQREALLQQFKHSKTQEVGKANRLYLVDPAGMLMMQYPYGFRHIGLMEDLKYLLKWSQIG